MEKNEFDFKANAQVTPQKICNLLVTAFDVGSMVAGWASARVEMPDDPDWSWCTQDEREYWESVRNIYVAAMCGGRVILVEHDDEDEEHTLDRKALHRGIKVMSEGFPRHWADFINQDDDVITGDVFVQCCLFGDTIYG